MEQMKQNNEKTMSFVVRHRYKKDGATLLLLCALVVLCWIPRLKGPIDFRFDGGMYYVLGTSLAQGKGYRLLNEPGDIQTPQYPPLLPIFVAVHQRLLGTSDPTIVGHQLRLSFFLLSIIYIAAVYAMLRMYLSLIPSFLGSLICLLHHMTLFMSDLLYTELPYALATVLFVIFLKMSSSNRLCGTATPLCRIARIAAPLCAIAAFALRSIGITLLIAYVGESLLNRKFKVAAARLALSLIPILCWQWYIRHVESAPEYTHPYYEYQRAAYMYPNVSYLKNIFSYKDPYSPELGPASLTDITRRVSGNIIAMPVRLGEAVSVTKAYWEFHRKTANGGIGLNMIPSWSIYGLLLLLGLLVVAGWAAWSASRHWLIPLYVFLYLMAMCLAPWPREFRRYLMPLAPFLVLFLLESLRGARAISQRTSSVRWKSIGIVFGGAVICLIFVFQITTIIWMYQNAYQQVVYMDRNGQRVEYRLLSYGIYKNFDDGLDWLRWQAGRGEVVAGPDPFWVHSRTGLKAIFPPFETDVDRAQHLLDSVPVKYLIVTAGAINTAKNTYPLVKSHPDQWALVYAVSNSRGVLYIYERIGLLE